MAKISKQQLNKVATKVQALGTEQDRLFDEFIRENGIERESDESDALFDVVFNNMNYEDFPFFKEHIELVD